MLGLGLGGQLGSVRVSQGQVRVRLGLGADEKWGGESVTLATVTVSVRLTLTRRN